MTHDLTPGACPHDYSKEPLTPGKSLWQDIKEVQHLFRVIPAYSSFKEYGEIRHSLEHTGQRVDQFDLLIGATALHHKMTLVTSNVKHFERMDELVIENWK